MMLKIKCPKCGIEGSLSLVESNYEGPYRCWKCRENFAIKIKNDKVKSCQPLSQEEFDKLQEIAAMKAKFKRQ